MMLRHPLTLIMLSGTLALAMSQSSADADEKVPLNQLSERAVTAMKSAAEFMTSKVAVHGGYVYEVSLDLKQRRGEGVASATEIWVQPPGTPTVGIAYIRSFEATKDPVFLDAAVQCAKALMHGQLASGCWTDRVDFDPSGKNADRYRNGKGKSKGRNYSTLDDNKSQSALRLLMKVDRLLEFKDESIHQAVQYGLDALLKAQFANGGFPQGWDEPVQPGTVSKASFPTYDWRTEGRFKNYWDFETLNDGLAGTVTETLQLAFEIYNDQQYRTAMIKFGDFLILAQLPEPQPAWAQQYNHQLQPIWARKFEPAAVAGRESEDVIETLLFLTEKTEDRRFLKPIPAALGWLKRSLLPDGQIARFYELQSNTPLYFTKDDYELTYDDSDLPTHYGFKAKSSVEKLETHYRILSDGAQAPSKKQSLKSLRKDAEEILAQLDESGRWVTDKNGRAVISINGLNGVELRLESKVFSKNMTRLAEFVTAASVAP